MKLLKEKLFGGCRVVDCLKALCEFLGKELCTGS
jgi:hypothetical protein